MAEATGSVGGAATGARGGGEAGPRFGASAPMQKTERVQVIDVLRGFALLGILVVNMAAFRGPIFGGADDGGVADRAAAFVISFGFEQKFYVLFSFLFGYGLAVQMARAAARGVPVVPRFARRLIGLLAIGVAHALLLFSGDILVTYAVLGAILLLLRDAPDRVLLGLSAVLLTLLPLVFAAAGTALAFSGADAAAGFRAEALAEAESGAEGYLGTPAEVIGQRAAEYPGSLGFALTAQGPSALAMFLLGLWAGRRRLFERAEDNPNLLRRALAAGLVVGVPGALVWAIFGGLDGFAFGAAFLLAGAVDFLTAPFLSAAYVAAITLAYRGRVWRRLLSPLAPVGRLALSNYLLQSLTGALIFTGYGLGLYGSVGAAWGLVLSLAIFAAQIPLSGWWLRRFDFGPAEWLLRSFTYARPQPLRAGKTGEPRRS